MGLFQSKPATAPVAFTLAPTVPTAPSVVQPKRSNIFTILIIIVGAFFLVYLGFTFYNYLRRRNGQEAVSIFGGSVSSDQTPTPVDGKTKKVIPAADVPLNSTMQSGVQFWMYIADWDYKFGQEKSILERVAPNNPAIKNPAISLAASENTLQVKVSLYGADSSAASSDLNGTGDVFTCSVENVPLQSWFSVSVTTFQRNLDIYINGRLVKSCVLPGVPKPAYGDIILNDNGGFSGSICNVHSHSGMITPEEAQSFFARGTNCRTPSPAASAVDKDSFFITLFGYTFKFSTLDKLGKEVSSLTL